MLCTFYLSFFFRLKTFSLALHPSFFFFKLKTFIVRSSNKFSGSIFWKFLFVFFSFVYDWLSLSSTSSFFLICITLTLFFFSYFFILKCNFEINGSFIYSTIVLLNELSFHVVGTVIQRQGYLMLQKKYSKSFSNS